MWVMLIIKGFLNQSNIPSQMGANYKRDFLINRSRKQKKWTYFYSEDLEIAENFCSEADESRNAQLFDLAFEDHVAGISL
jgi:hypothetical protein